MIRLLVLSIFLFPSVTLAKTENGRRFHWGIAIPFAAKFQLLPNKGTAYEFFGQGSICLATVIDGKDDMALKLSNRIGLLRDNIEYRYMNTNIHYAIEQLKLTLNPEVLIPLRNEKLCMAAGFGLDWRLSTGAFYSFSGSTYSITNQQLDALNEKVIETQKALVPFISIGLRRHIAKGGYLQAFIRQNMQNDMEGNPTVPIGGNPGSYRLTLHHQPTYFGLCFMYYFR